MPRLSPDDEAAWSELLKKHSFDCVVIGPEVPLANGLADFLRKNGVPTVGPSQTAAQLESSKVFSKEFMQKAGVPTARFVVVDSKESCLEQAKNFRPPFVLKADGLASGKGVFICDTMTELEVAAHSLFVEKALGDAGTKAVLEAFQLGYEISYLVLSNGRDFRPLPISQDHKRLLDEDQGPNTGGMGAVGPIPGGCRTLGANSFGNRRADIEANLRDGLLYRGVIYFGLMITAGGPVCWSTTCDLEILRPRSSAALGRRLGSSLFKARRR